MLPRSVQKPSTIQLRNFMNMLMSHMADHLQLEGYKKTEGNEAQAKKSLGML